MNSTKLLKPLGGESPAKIIDDEAGYTCRYSCIDKSLLEGDSTGAYDADYSVLVGEGCG
jgi:hypothetical protein